MFKMIHRKALLRCMIFGVISAALLITIGASMAKNNENDTSAASGLTLNVGNYVYVHDVHYWENGKRKTITDYSHYYTASGFTDNNNGKHGIFCVEPLESTPADGTNLQYRTPQYDSEHARWYEDLKLLLFIYRYYDRFQFIEDARRAIMETDDTDTYYNYFWFHMLASWLMSTDGRTDVWPNYYPWQNVAYYYDYNNSPTDQGWFRRAEGKLHDYIDGNDILWKLAQKQTLYETTNTSQRLMFVGNANFDRTSITVTKTCDNSDGTCAAATAAGASLAGIKFRITNASNDTIYDFTNGKSYAPGARVAQDCKTNDEGKCTFNNLPADGYTYKIEEVGSNSSYDITADDQTITLNSGSPRALTFSDKPRVGGKIKVQKCDAETDTSDNYDCSDPQPQGNANFKGIKFVLYKNGESTGIEKTTNASGYVEFSGLEFGDYTVVEGPSNASYVLNNDDKIKTISLTSDHPVGELAFHNEPVRGSITVYKIDSETGTCVTSKGDSFAGTTFKVINKSRNPIIYDGRTIEVNSEVTPEGGIVFTEDTCSFTIDGLPYGKYQVKETKAAPSYKKAAPVTITIPGDNGEVNLSTEIRNEPTFELGTRASDADDGDNYINADKEAKIIDHVEYCARAGKEYTMSGVLMDKETGEAVKINGKRVVESSIEFTAQETCGEIDMEFAFDASELGGHDVVVFETLYDENDKPVVSHSDIDDEGQTVEMIYIHTTATDASTDEKVLPAGEDVTIKDVVDYCLKPGLEYRLEGVIMDKSTGNGLLVNSEPVVAEATFTPEERCGSIELSFNLNTSGLEGKKLVVFESLYRGEELINEHKDLEDVDQSVDVEIPAPETGAFTRTKGMGEVGSIILPAGFVTIVSLGGYAIMRHNSRKKFFQK